MLDNFLIRTNEDNLNYRFFSPKELKRNIQSPSINGLSLYEDQSKFLRNILEVGTCEYLKFHFNQNDQGFAMEQKERFFSLPISTNIGGLEALTKFEKLLNLGNVMLESFFRSEDFSHFGIDFIPLESIQANQRESEKDFVERTNRKNAEENFFGKGNSDCSMISIAIPQKYMGTPEILIPEIVFYHENLFNKK